jgi:hypothetical protein
MIVMQNKEEMKTFGFLLLDTMRLEGTLFNHQFDGISIEISNVPNEQVSQVKDILMTVRHR